MYEHAVRTLPIPQQPRPVQGVAARLRAVIVRHIAGAEIKSPAPRPPAAEVGDVRAIEPDKDDAGAAVDIVGGEGPHASTAINARPMNCVYAGGIA